MDTIDESRIVIQSLNADWYHHKVDAVDILRLDLIHPVISGNKWYKLKHHIDYAVSNCYQKILTFGGAYSNHLVAAAAAARQAGLECVGIVRGIYESDHLNATLQTCLSMGMQLQFVSREDYGKKNEPDFLQALAASYNNPFIIPEGGASEWGRTGAGLIADLVPDHYTDVCLSVGTATTMTGLRNALPIATRVIGFAPMKQGIYLEQELHKYLEPVQNKNWELTDRWHFGGFGKHDEVLIQFMNDFYAQNSIPLDVVYTSKMMYGVRAMLMTDKFEKGARVLCIHSGGLQGNSSVADKLIFK